MKVLVTILLILIFAFGSFAQENKHIIGIYSTKKIRKGMGCIGLGEDGFAYYILISAGSFNTIIRTKYILNGDTIKIPELDNYFWHDRKLYMLGRNNVVFKGGLKKANEKLLRRLKNKYEVVLKQHNICFKNGLLEQCDK